jgi:hypothetical protein
VRRVPWSTWLVGWAAAIVFAGGSAVVIAEATEQEPEIVERTVRVLPGGQTELTGRVSRLAGTDVVGPPIRQTIRLESGTASVELPDQSIVWDGGRPFVLEGGGLDLGPTSVVVERGTATWTIDGPRVLLPGDYALRTPVAIGAEGLARPVDSHSFTAGDDAVLDAPAGTVATPAAPLHLEGPGSLVLDGTFELRTREGKRSAAHVEFGPGPLLVDIEPDGSINATLNGPLRSS